MVGMDRMVGMVQYVSPNNAPTYFSVYWQKSSETRSTIITITVNCNTVHIALCCNTVHTHIKSFFKLYKHLWIHKVF